MISYSCGLRTGGTNASATRVVTSSTSGSTGRIPSSSSNTRSSVSSNNRDYRVTVGSVANSAFNTLRNYGEKFYGNSSSSSRTGETNSSVSKYTVTTAAPAVSKYTVTTRNISTVSSSTGAINPNNRVSGGSATKTTTNVFINFKHIVIA